MGFFRRGEKLTPEQELTKQQIKATKSQIRELKAARKEGRGEGLGRILGAFGKAFPKGIRTQDSLVRNLHLYKPRMGRHKTILK